MKIIGIAGKARTGKDTIANHLVEKHGFVQLAFADPIREIVYFLCSAQTLPDDKEEPIYPAGVSQRRMMQDIGDMGRRWHVDYWVQQLEDTLKTWEPDTRVVISDIRYENEANWIRKRGWLWHVTRPNNPYSVRAHSSENGVTFDGSDALIQNSETLDDLRDHVDYLLASRFTSQ